LYLCFRYLEYHTISLSLHSITFFLSQKLVGLKGTQGEGKPVGGRNSDASPGQHLAPAIASPQCPQSGCPLKTNPVALGRKKGVATMGVVEIAAREREEMGVTGEGSALQHFGSRLAFVCCRSCCINLILGFIYSQNVHVSSWSALPLPVFSPLALSLSLSGK